MNEDKIQWEFKERKLYSNHKLEPVTSRLMENKNYLESENFERIEQKSQNMLKVKIDLWEVL